MTDNLDVAVVLESGQKSAGNGIGGELQVGLGIAAVGSCEGMGAEDSVARVANSALPARSLTLWVLSRHSPNPSMRLGMERKRLLDIRWAMKLAELVYLDTFA